MYLTIGTKCMEIKNCCLNYHQNNECIASVTWATVCSPIGISSFLKATLETTELGSASIIILEKINYDKIFTYPVNGYSYPPSQISSIANITMSSDSKTTRFSTFFLKI